jgi:plastocyanin
MNRKITAIVVLLVAAFGAAGCAAQGSVRLVAEPVVFDVNVIEIKGSTDGIEAPGVDPGGLSAGYKFWPPGEFDSENAAKWQVSSYMFSPSELVVVQGSEVTLRTFVLNGDAHVSWLVAPDGSKVPGTEVTLNRGRQYEIKFAADQAGYYSWECANHAPTMTAKILALPSS